MADVVVVGAGSIRSRVRAGAWSQEAPQALAQFTAEHGVTEPVAAAANHLA